MANVSDCVPEVRQVGGARLPTTWGVFDVASFRERTGREHLALIPPSAPESAPVPASASAVPVEASQAPAAVSTGPAPLVRIHSECLTGDVLGSLRCDCGQQLHESMRRVSAARRGAVIYLRGHEGRGIGLAAKISAYGLQDAGLDTVEANLRLGYPVDARDYSVAAAILGHLGLWTVSLLTNNPGKVTALRRHGIDVTQRVPLVVEVAVEADRYLRTKRDRMGHHLSEYRCIAPDSPGCQPTDSARNTTGE
ncbi:MAG: GTP cyclohydrolase II [Micrococcales bacterium]|nr:MAG: GTP cyclohydrolase II [Micrococcales bacterium]PIE27032.1 MAG: GTP cyclohydrolase II [Micrococcales bacterium]